MKRLLVVKQKGTELCLSVTEKSEIVKNPVPILWFNDGLYGWVSKAIVINETTRFLDNEKICSGLQVQQLEFSWNLIQRPIQNDIGEVLEQQDNTIAGLTELLNEKLFTDES